MHTPRKLLDCKDCGHQWFAKYGTDPNQCANSHCRSRHWKLGKAQKGPRRPQQSSRMNPEVRRIMQERGVSRQRAHVLLKQAKAAVSA
jgi:hypothetical protein